MKIMRKILAVFKQILVLPLKALITATGGFWMFWIIYTVIAGIYGENGEWVLLAFVGIIYSILAFSVSIVPFMILESFKKTGIDPIPCGDGTSYLYEEKVKHDIFWEDGTVIGHYETKESKEGYDMSFREFVGILKYLLFSATCFFCGIISLIFSIIGCFTDKYFMKIRTPILHGKRFSKFLHKYFDIVYIK
ncbi:MAG: hypothetical protein IJX51_03345 [Clostridia bacterium]|nr:hypothetical protein [Clostridia bacterium]